ncbi:aminotransferase [Solemya velesiana gill symbiont]|uniref:Aminotransferase n=2 Tax=Solemya velesiana gill symbiont TaxID=1918948 RepID=A0A1T2KSQ1_9GAMM|nr:aminotransferase [Solemya velesiana gill symbiont]
MELLARARQLESEGRSIIHMEVGEPDFPTPDPIVEAGRQALMEDHTHYTPAMGITELREAIAGHYATRFGCRVDPQQVVVTPGSSGALQLVMGVLVNPGEAVLMADPGYPCNRHFVYLAGGDPVTVPVGPATQYQLTAELVEKAWTPNTKAVMLATPSNPTGTLVSRQAMEEIHEVVKSRNGVLIIDEIYQGLVYGGEEFTAASIADDIFVINSFSKYFGMTGWRLGWMIAPREMVAAVDKLAQNIFLSPPTPSQHAALAAFTEETQQILESRREAFRARRDFLLPKLQELGFEMATEPQGAFYLYANCSSLTGDSFDFAMRLLEEEGGAITPGKDFGSNRPEQHVRFAYTTDISKLEEGVKRIARFLGRS